MIFYLIISIPFVLLSITGLIYYLKIGKNKNYSDDFRGDGMFVGTFIVECLITLIFLIATMVCSSNNTFNKEDLKKTQKYETILNDKANNLTTQFAKYLAELYPNLEKNIFKDISPKDVDIYLVKYPQLKSSDTIKKLVSEISKLQDAVYQQKLNEARIQRDIDYYHNNPWLLFTTK